MFSLSQMQFPEMKSILRSFHSPKHLLYTTYSLSRQFPQYSRPIHRFSRQFHSTSLRLFSSEESSPKSPPQTTSPQVWSIYDPAMTAGLVSRTETGDPSSEPESESEAESSGADGGDLGREKTEWRRSRDFGDRRHVRGGGGYAVGEFVGVKRKGKKSSRVSWVCSDCGYSDGQWWGTCRSCHGVGTLKQFSEVKGGERRVEERTWLPQNTEGLQPLRLRDVNTGVNHMDWRIPLSGSFGNEVARVLGGGLVPGSLVLIGGDPGVGKSTLLLQMAAMIAEGHELGESAPVVYVSGEESIEQIGNRADRMRIGAEELFLYSSTDVEDILAKIQDLSPRALIIDSIQTVFLREVAGSAGGLMQVRECTSTLLRFAKTTKIPILLAGHVTKSGDIAGPRVLEHIVDAVLYMEGEKFSSYRLLRPAKNRFGSTDELGVFEMSQLGLQAVSNPSEMFLSDEHSDSEFLAGLAVAVVLDGSRTFLIEIQALCVSGSTVSRHVNGIQPSRADMIISVLTKQAGLKLQENSVFLNVVSGMAVTETAGDLAVAAAICSSFLEFPIPKGIAFIGEVGLGGELRMVAGMDKRVGTVAKLGYRKCIVPKSAEKTLAALGYKNTKIIGCMNLKEVINVVFTTPET